MGYVKEPEGVDFIINGGSLSNEDAKKVSAIIQRYKKEHNVQKSARVKRVVPLRKKKELS